MPLQNPLKLSLKFEKMSDSEQQSSSQLDPRGSGIPSPNDSINDAEELETEIVEAATSKKGRGMALDYSEVAVMEDYPKALKYMTDYKYRFKNEANAGDKYYYRCKGFSNCKNILMHVDSLQCTIFQSSAEHYHELNSAKIDPQVYDLVKDCLNDKVVSQLREKCCLK